MTNHPHSYRFPYVVESTLPTVYRVYHIVFNEDIKTVENQNNILIEDSDPFVNGDLNPPLRDVIIKIVTEWNSASHKRLCVVFGPKDCIYFEKDGSLKSSKQVPSGGVDLYDTFDEIPSVLDGLQQCSTCGYFHGSCFYKEESWEISCACDPNICDRCNKPVYKWKITSNWYDPVDATCWHTPILHAWGHKCPDGVSGQLKNSFLIDPRTGEDLLNRD